MGVKNLEIHDLWLDSKLVEDISFMSEKLNNTWVYLGMVSVEDKLFDEGRKGT